jgi:hypothetical protein
MAGRVHQCEDSVRSERVGKQGADSDGTVGRVM